MIKRSSNRLVKPQAQAQRLHIGERGATMPKKGKKKGKK